MSRSDEESLTRPAPEIEALEASSRKIQRIMTVTLGLAVVACVGMAAHLFQDSPHSQNKFEHLPVLQAWISWQPETQALMQKSDASEFATAGPSVENLLKDPVALKTFSNDLFKKVDSNSDGTVERDEMVQCFKDLVKEGVIGSMPNEAEAKQIEAIAGTDMKIQPDEFEKVVLGTVQAMAVGQRISEASKVAAAGPSVENLLKDPAALKKFSDDLFKKVDSNSDGNVEKVEMVQAFKDLVEDDVIGRMPNEAEAKQIEAIAGEDKKIQPAEFEKVVVATAQAMAQR